MDWKNLYQKIEVRLEFTSKWIGYISAIILATGFISQFFAWGNQGLFAYLTGNLQSVWFFTFTIIAFTLWLWVSRLNSRFTSRFRDNFSENLNINWDFIGPWRVAEKNTLLVTGSDAGGLTKVGATWENYTFSFDARITDKCLGVIVRAQDLDNYYMFQINPDKIRPHRRVATPVIEDDTTQSKQKQSVDESSQARFIKFKVAWQVFDSQIPINPPLTDWFRTKIIVRGESVQIYIDNELRFQQESFLKIPMGKVGFRNTIRESALVRNVQVMMQP